MLCHGVAAAQLSVCGAIMVDEVMEARCFVAEWHSSDGLQGYQLQMLSVTQVAPEAIDGAVPEAQP